MASNSNKVKDPTEVALSAIQEALNLNDPPSKATDIRIDPADDYRGNIAVDRTTVDHEPQHGYEPQPSPPAADFDQLEPPVQARRAANDDRETIGQILQTIQRGRPRRNAYTIATLFAGLWVATIGVLTFAFLPSLQSLIGAGGGGALALAGLAALFFVPIMLFYFLASIAWRGQELGLIAQSMAQVAIRFSEPEGSTRDSMITVGQAVRREVAAMGDGIERAIARAGELETLVSNEVAALERAYSDNEVRIRALLQDIAHQRDNLVGQAEQVRNAISGVQIDLRQDVAVISDAIAARVDEVAKTITTGLQERGDHILRTLNNEGDRVTLGFSERGADLLDRLEEESSKISRVVLDATERLAANLNFKTGHVHDDFVELTDRIHDMMDERLDRVTGEFQSRADGIVEGIASRTDQIHEALKATGESLLLELDLRSTDIAARIDEAGNRLAEQMLTSGDKANEALDVTVNSLISKVAAETENAHETLSGHIGAFEDLLKSHGGELAEKFTRDSGTLGALITRHVAEFDRTVKTFGGEIVERLGQRTQDISESLRAYVDSFDNRVSASGEHLTGALDSRIGRFENELSERFNAFDSTIESKVGTLDQAVTSHLKAFETAFDTRAQTVNDGLELRLASFTSALNNGSTEAITALDSRIASVTSTIDNRLAHFTTSLKETSAETMSALDTRIAGVAETIPHEPTPPRPTTAMRAARMRA